MPTRFKITRTQTFLLPFSLAFVILADFLFYGQPLGWDLALFLGIAAAAVVVRSPSLWRHNTGRIAMALAAFILLALVEEPSPLAILMAAVALGTLVLISRGGWTSSLSAWLARWCHLLATLPLHLLMDTRIEFRWFRTHPSRRSVSILLPFRWFVPLLAGGIFLLLFILANPIIEQWASRAFTDFFDILRRLPDFLEPARITLWLAAGLGVYGLLRYRGHSPIRTLYLAIPPIFQRRPTTAHHFIIRCLIVFNLIFAVQSVLDVVYLFGGTRLPSGMTYTQYAHRGAYPLIATALLAGLFVLAAFRTHGPAHRSRLARQLVYFWIAQNIFLMFSTIWRTWIYINATLLTELRVAVFIWVFLLAMGFVYIIVKIRAHRSNGWLCGINALTLGAVLYLCAFINFPGLIADFNVHRCREITGRGDSLDIRYLERLGPAAIPALQWIGPQLPASRQPRAARAENRLAAALTASLANWRSWTFRRARIAEQAGPPANGKLPVHATARRDHMGH